ncbi:hypothetical protein SAE01_40120 [Segetibacter aerophilus]|uniref:Secretion system C-terminal sorting domain-containing protein n=2 Tax=Segetibacter aerophilus TaxID=670293 RepID=A0A512BHQ3_9BACT|nr:hypothetical protein SAE01_40120 [Segetibacter aerophilus]
MIFTLGLIAQPPVSVPFQQYNGEPGIRRSISQLLASPPDPIALEARNLLSLKKPEFNMVEFRGFQEKIEANRSRTESANEEGDDDDITTKQSSSEALVLPGKNPFNIWSNFLASNLDEAHSWPPDPNGDVGPSQVVALMNAGIKVFEKRSVTDAPLVTPKGIHNTPAPSTLFITLDQFFAPLIRPGAYTSDPHVRYDRLTKRWFVVAIEVNPSFSNNFVLLAVSDGERITNVSSFIYYRFPSALIAFNPATPFAPFLDYPMLGVDKNAVLIGGNDFFINNFGGVDSLYFVGYALNKRRLLQGQLTLYAIKFGAETPTGGSGIIIPQGVHNDDPLATRSFFAGINFQSNAILLAGLNFNANSQLTSITQYTVPVEHFQFPRDVTAPGSPMPIDPLDTRLLAAAIYKNKLTGKSSLWTSHVIGVNQAGHYVPDNLFVNEARTASRWYEIDNIYTSPGLNQLGTVYDPTTPSGRRAMNYFNSSIAANGQGHGALGGTQAAFNRYLNVFVAGRSNMDAPGTLANPERATNAHAIYAPHFEGYGYIGRWGDYSQTVVDPIDDQTIWTFQEYANADDSYGVRAVQLKAPPPATPLPLAPLSNKNNSAVVIEGLSVDNSGFFDPGADVGGPGYNRLTVKSTGNIIVTNLKFISPTKISFTLSTKNKPAGKYTLIITNPDGQFVVVEFKIVKDVSTTQTSSSSTGLTQAGIEKLQQDFVKASSVFPNPTENDVTVRIDAAKNYKGKIVVLDLSGKRLSERNYSFTKGNNQSQVSLAGYTKGAYIIAVFNSENLLVAHYKVVKN